MRQQVFGSPAQAQGKEATNSCARPATSTRDTPGAPALAALVVDSSCCPATSRRPECTACWYETIRKRAPCCTHCLKTSLKQAAEGECCRKTAWKKPQAGCCSPGLPSLLLRSWLAGLMPSSYVSWIPLWTRLLQILDGCAGNFFLRHGFVWEMRKMLAARARRATPRTGPRDLENQNPALPAARPHAARWLLPT
jgi:hypothetical protein